MLFGNKNELSNSNGITRKKRLVLASDNYERERVKRFKKEIVNTSQKFEQGLNNENEMMDFQYEGRKNTIKNTYEEQKQLLNTIINKLINQNKGNYNHGFLGSRPLIHGKASEIRSIPNLLERRERVKNLYDILQLFSGLIGRKEFNGSVTTQDLDAIKIWLNKTDMKEILKRYQISIPTANDCFSHWAKPVNWRSSHNCPLEENKKEYDGSKIGISLREAKARLEQEIQNWNGSNKNFILSIINHTFINNEAADNNSKITFKRIRWFSYSEVEEICYYKNGVKVGRLFQETGGKRYGIKEGCFGHEEGFYQTYYKGAWEKVQTWFENDLNETIAALKSRAILLFDLETNPESLLQDLYRHSYRTNNAIIQFPSKEIDALVKQCNEFIKFVM